MHGTTLRIPLNVFLVVTLAVGTSAACATKGFVTESVERRVAEVRKRVVVVERSVEEVAGGSRANTARIGEVDQIAVTDSKRPRRLVTRLVLPKTPHREGLRTSVPWKRRTGSSCLKSITEDHDQFGFADTVAPQGSWTVV